jgi:hypothetical protein
MRCLCGQDCRRLTDMLPKEFWAYGHAESKKNAEICLPLGITTKPDFVSSRLKRHRTYLSAAGREALA